MFESVTVIGAGRAGSAIAARLRERGVRLTDDGELRLLCVPDRAIADASRAIPAGPWVAHVSGATPLGELAPHVRRFSVHPLQTLIARRGPEQLDGAWAAITGETPEALAHARGPGRDARTATLRPRRRPARAVPRRRGDRVELPRHPPSRCGAAPGRRRRSARGARSPDGADDCERFRADGATRPRRRDDRRTAPGGDPRRRARAGAALHGARGGDRGSEGRGEDRRGACRVACGARHRRPGADDGRPARRARSAVSRRPAGLRRARREPVRQPGTVLGAQRSRGVSARPRRRRGGRRVCRRRPALRTGRSTSSTRRDSPRGSSRAAWQAGSSRHTARAIFAALRPCVSSSSTSCGPSSRGSAARTPNRSPC